MPRETVKAPAFGLLSRVHLPGTWSYKTWASNMRNRKRKEKIATGILSCAETKPFFISLTSRHCAFSCDDVKLFGCGKPYHEAQEIA